MKKRHLNCKPMTIIGDRKPAVSMSQQTKRGLQAEIELLTRDYLANGGEIKQLASEQVRPMRSPAFNDLPAEFGEDAA